MIKRFCIDIKDLHRNNISTLDWSERYRDESIENLTVSTKNDRPRTNQKRYHNRSRINEHPVKKVKLKKQISNVIIQVAYTTIHFT